nr:MAG TPA: major capsid protein [Caudoviricetes sp.]
MTKILELREKRAKAWKAAKAFLDTKRGNDGLLSAEDTTAYEKMEADVVALGREIERLERQAAIDAELNAPTSNAITNVPQRPGEDNKIGRARDEYRRDFFAAMRGRTVTNVLSEGVDADGGYLVPTEFERTIVQGLDEDNVIRKLAKTITTSVERKVPIAATPSVATWVAENGAIPESGVTFDQKTLDAYKLTDLVKVSVELLADSMFDLESYLAAEFARAMGVAEEEAFCVGNGTGRPSGIFTENGGHVGATSSGASITFDDVINLVYSLKTPYRRNAVFLTNDSTVSAFRKLKDSNGQYLWQPALAQGQPDRLFGYPLYTTPYAPTIAAGAFAAAFGDFSNYWIADRAGRTLQRLNELYAGNGQVGFLATERVDGKVILSEGIQLLKMAGGA